MKKLSTLFLLSLSCICMSMALVACDEGESSSSSSSSSATPCIVTFEEGEGFSYIINDDDLIVNTTVGSTLSFKLDVGAFYTGEPTVLANGANLSVKDDVYSFTVTGNTTITVEGIREDVSSMIGTGAQDNAFVVSRPIDLLYIAEKVNAGDEAYTSAYYILGNDIDCKGETIDVIGDMNNERAFFSGCFSCYNDGSTIERYTISNFNINTNDSNYVGLFGCVQADLTKTSSGLFYGIRLDNFTINAGTNGMQSDTKSIYAGGLIGYGLGVQAYLCDATNGKINVFADNNYFSFAGGLIGCLQGSYLQNYNQIFTAEIAYANVDVDVTCTQGSCLYAGGIVAYAFTDSLIAPAYIHNAYATGNVNGAMRSGGIAGGLGQYCSVSNCYSTGDVSAKTSQNEELVTSDEYLYAVASGIVGFAENDTVVNDCFSAGQTYASSFQGANYVKTSHAVAYGYEAGNVSVNSQAYQVYNCVGSVTKENASSIAKNTMLWREHDWVFTSNAFPTILYDAYDGSVATVITVNYVCPTADGDKTVKVFNETKTEITYEDSYAPLVDAFNNGYLPLYLTDDNGYLSYGYFFDEACTKPVPYSYLTTHDVDLYVGFANPTPILNTYVLDTQNGKVEVTLKADGFAYYTDGNLAQVCRYQYDGEIILFENVSFAKFYTGAVDTTISFLEDPLFDLNRYNYCYCYAEVNNDTLRIYDGVYFTKVDPLFAYLQNSYTTIDESAYLEIDDDIVLYTFRLDGTGTRQVLDTPKAKAFTYTKAGDVITFNDNTTLSYATLKHYDAFKGTWSKTTSVGKTYIFDGMGSYTYQYGAVKTQGEYTIVGDTLHIGATTISINSDGYLLVNGETFYRGENFMGKWKDARNGVTLALKGLNKDGFGNASLIYDNGYSYTLIYEPSETAGYVCLYLVESQTMSEAVTYNKYPFGYCSYNASAHSLSAVLFDPFNVENSYSSFTLTLIDEYEGNWISEDELLGLLTFNGAGNYYNNFSQSGWITIGEDEVVYTLNNLTLQGQFTYKNNDYTILLNEENQTVTVTCGQTTVILQRQDCFSGLTFVDFDLSTFTEKAEFIFDGKGNLPNGGSFVYNDKTYTYKTMIENESFDIFDGANKVGTIVQKEDYYLMTLNSETKKLYLKNDYMGNWAISGAFDLFKIGPTTLKGDIIASFEDLAVKMSYIDPTTLTFSCELNNMPLTYYVFMLKNESNAVIGLALSQYASVIYGDYTFCTPVNTMYGEWKQTDTDFTMSFDGVTFDEDNRYCFATAYISYAGYSTPYYYIYNDDNEVIMWSQTLLQSYTQYFVLKPCSAEETGAYVHADGRAFKRVAIDSLYKTVAKDKDNASYVFDGGNVNGNKGTVTVTNPDDSVITYTYVITAYNNNNTATLILTAENDKKYTAILDYSNPDAQTITLTELVESDN